MCRWGEEGAGPLFDKLFGCRISPGSFIYKLSFFLQNSFLPFRAYIDVDNLTVGAHEPCNDALDKILLLLTEFYQSVFGGRTLLPAHFAVTTGGRTKETDGIGAVGD